MMKLVDILARDLKAWPERVYSLSQMRNGYIINGRGFDGVAFDLLEIAEETLIAGAIVTREQWQAAVDALDTPETDEWSGEGLPPVGTVCEQQTWVNREWRTVTVAAHFNNFAVCVWEESDGDSQVELAPPGDLRPIRTAEQIAAEKRDKEAEDLAEVMTGHRDRSGDCYLTLAKVILDAGYRKQVTP